MGLFHRKKIVIPENPVLVNDSSPFSSAVRLDGLERYEKFYARLLPEERKKALQNQKYKTERGLRGEELTLKALLRTPLHMLILKDLHFLYGETAAQIDFIAISDKLIFVIESKNWKSNVKIDSSGEFVTMDAQKRRENPFAQNTQHTEYIKRIYQGLYPNDKVQRFQNLVVWANEASVLERSEAPDTVVSTITYAKNLPNFILEKYEACTLKKLKPAVMQDVADSFLTYCYEHETEHKCPVCGRQLVLRSAKTTFWGCSGFQDGCRYTEQVIS